MRWGSLLKPGGERGPQPPTPETRPYPLETPPARRCRSGSGARGQTCRWTGSPRCPERKAGVTPGQPGHSLRGDSISATHACADRGWQGRRSRPEQAQPQTPCLQPPAPLSPERQSAHKGAELSSQPAHPTLSSIPAPDEARHRTRGEPGRVAGHSRCPRYRQQGAALAPRCGSDSAAAACVSQWSWLHCLRRKTPSTHLSLSWQIKIPGTDFLLG